MPIEKGKLQEFAIIRRDEAQALLERSLPSGAFHLAGLAIELAIKACIAKRFEQHVIPDREFINKIYSHDLQKLLELASLDTDLNKASRGMQHNWEIVKAWTVESRYFLIEEKDAQEMIAALSEPPDGVFTWIQMHW